MRELRREGSYDVFLILYNRVGIIIFAIVKGFFRVYNSRHFWEVPDITHWISSGDLIVTSDHIYLRWTHQVPGKPYFQLMEADIKNYFTRQIAPKKKKKLLRINIFEILKIIKPHQLNSVSPFSHANVFFFDIEIPKIKLGQIVILLH